MKSRITQFKFLIFQFLLVSAFFAPISTSQIEINATSTLYLSNFDVSEVFDNKMFIQAPNTTGGYESLAIYPQSSISIEIYGDEIINPFPTPFPGPPLPIPPPETQIDFIINHTLINVGLKLSNGSHTIEILDGYDAFGLYATEEAMQAIVDNQTNPDFDYINTSAEFGIKTWHYDIRTGSGPDGQAQDNSYQEYYERRYSKETGLLTYMQFDEGYVRYECCGLEKHYILSPNSAEKPSSLSFSGFFLFPLTLVSLILLKKR